MTGLGNIDDVYKHYLIVIEENAKLKELLKECRGSIEVCLENARIYESYTGTEYFKGLLSKIDNTIGENK